MISRVPNTKIDFIAPILILVIPFLTFVQVTNPVISFLLLLMISLLPGMAVLELFHFSFHSVTIRFFYALLFSILLLMTVFTIYSTIAHASGITAPLSTVPVKIICLIILLPVSSILLRRLTGSDSSSIKPFNWMIFLPRAFAVSLPAISVICAMRLNSFSDATSTSIFLLFLLAFLLVLTIKSSISPDTNLQSWFVYGISAALVLGSTFRGDGGFWGFDINQEFASASKVLSQGFWVSPKVSGAYDSMLSITVLPVVLSLFSNLSLTIIFKVFYALVLAYIPTVLFMVCVRYVSRFTAMSVTGVLVIGSISFIPQMTALNRQVIGFVFFVGILLVINETNWTLQRKKIVGLTMACGMAASHYSTAYLASAMFAIFLPLSLLNFFFSSKRFVYTRRVFTPTFSLSLILITVIWNGVITQTLLDSKPVIDRTLSQGIDFLPNQNQSLWTRWISGTIPVENLNSTVDIRLSNLQQNKTLGFTATPESLNYQLRPAEAPFLKPFFGAKAAATYSNLLTLGRTLFQFFAVFGLLLLIIKIFTGKKWTRVHHIGLDVSQSLDLLGIGIAALLIGFIARTSGTLGSAYNPERIALQIAIVLLIPTAVAIQYVLFQKNVINVFLAVPVVFFLIVILMQATSLSGYVSGSDVSRISNLQRDYSSFVISESERRASRWLAENVPASSYLQTDNGGFLALLQNRPRTSFNSLDPVNLLKGSYIYAANSNVVGGVSAARTFFVFPEDYIDQHYQIVYSTNRARIYH
jgi:uncharacterized membrane protein